ncbi:MAG: 1,2-phenylacetyl-CoA epoxidase subunit PaaD [Pseudomonadota bacterium]
MSSCASVEQVWAWLHEIEDPEIPVISIVDLGVVREVQFEGHTCRVAITPTYSGCPATEVIAQSVRDTLARHGLSDVRLETRIAPAWTTDWISDGGRQKLRAYGIAPPIGLASEASIRVEEIGRGPVGRASPDQAPRGLACPQCGSTRVAIISQFGSTPCKALARCSDCAEPFDYFKCH